MVCNIGGTVQNFRMYILNLQREHQRHVCATGTNRTRTTALYHCYTLFWQLAISRIVDGMHSLGHPAYQCYLVVAHREGWMTLEWESLAKSWFRPSNSYFQDMCSCRNISWPSDQNYDALAGSRRKWGLWEKRKKVWNQITCTAHVFKVRSNNA